MSFWDKNLNPITMLPAGTTAIYPKKTVQKNNVDLDIYIHFQECRHILGIGAKKIKAHAEKLNEIAIYTINGVYYKKSTIEAIKEIMKSEISVKKEIDSDKYISNAELMQMFQFSEFKAWKIVKENSLRKYNFGGKKIYYEIDKAIELFGKFKK